MFYVKLITIYNKISFCYCLFLFFVAIITKILQILRGFFQVMHKIVNLKNYFLQEFMNDLVL